MLSHHRQSEKHHIIDVGAAPRRVIPTIENETEAKNEFLKELVRTEDAKIKQALEKLHSRLDETDKEKAYKWTAYYLGLVDGGD